MKKKIELRVNNEQYNIDVEPHRTLLEILREDLELTGAKKGCNEGNCGTCTIIMDGDPVASCLVLAIEADRKEIFTIESLIKNGKLHPIQEAFVEYGALQCGFCTPGMIMSAKALLDKNHNPNEEDVRKAISGNLCRCTGYTKIVEAILAVSKS